MRRIIRALALLLLILTLSAACFAKSKSLRIYSIDVEGGQATLIVSPLGESLLVDTGWPGFDGRDASRIADAVKAAGLNQIDDVLITHFHRDHVGGVGQLADKVRVVQFIDHGPNLEDSDVTREDYAAYQKVIEHSPHASLRPGDGLPFKGMKVEVLTAAGEHIDGPLPGAGAANPYCTGEPQAADDPSENGRSMGILVTFGKFKFLDMGDLTKKRELELMCPNNRIGTVDLLMVSHHGAELSSSKALVHAVHPRAAIMNNGAHKGGSAEAWQTVHDSPGLEGFWQLHYAVEAGKDHNVDEKMIANVEGGNDGNRIEVVAERSGAFTVENSRNGVKQKYGK